MQGPGQHYSSYIFSLSFYSSVFLSVRERFFLMILSLGTRGGGGSERQKVIEVLNWTRRSCQLCMHDYLLSALASIVLPNMMTSCVREDSRDGNRELSNYLCNPLTL